MEREKGGWFVWESDAVGRVEVRGRGWVEKLGENREGSCSVLEEKGDGAVVLQAEDWEEMGGSSAAGWKENGSSPDWRGAVAV
jgi:hypothetical protein